MGDLPAFRLDSYSPQFSDVEVDYFGPLETSPGRNRVLKRDGVIITCLVTRGVFLALAESLSTDDFLLVFRRFIGIYTKREPSIRTTGPILLVPRMSSIHLFKNCRKVKRFNSS